MLTLEGGKSNKDMDETKKKLKRAGKGVENNFGKNKKSIKVQKQQMNG